MTDIKLFNVIVDWCSLKLLILCCITLKQGDKDDYSIIENGYFVEYTRWPNVNSPQ